MVQRYCTLQLALRLVVLFQAWIPTLTQSTCNAAAALQKCEQVEKISIASQATPCEYRRVFYNCMLLEGCYYNAACRQDQNAVVCIELCEAETILPTCVHEQNLAPPQDYHLCPHIPKDLVSTQAPTLDDFLAAPALPYTLTVWTSFRALDSADPATLLPTVLPAAMGKALASLFQLDPLAVVVNQPISHVKGALTLPGSLEAPDWTQHTSFMSLNIHIRNNSDIQRMQSLADLTLLEGFQTEDRAGLEVLEESLAQELDLAFPVAANLELARLQVNAKKGITEEFPTLSETTSEAVTTTTEEPKLQIQRWRAYRVRCMLGTVHRWEVAELHFFADRCPENGGTQLFQGYEPISSESYEDHPAVNAFDLDPNATRTIWLSSCAGCAAGSTWIGLDAVNSSFRVACVQLSQAQTATNMCGNISLEASNDLITWEVLGEIHGLEEHLSLCVPRTARDFPTLQCGTLADACGGDLQLGRCAGSQEFCDANVCVCQGRLQVTDNAFSTWECGDYEDGCGGNLRFGNCDNSTNASCSNHRCKEDAFAAVFWRLICTGSTVGRWVVREVRFHTDGLCVVPFTSFRRAKSSGSQYAEYPAILAFDGERSTSWISSCHACEPNEAWLGLEFVDSVVVRCVRILQNPRTSQQCPTFSLEYSDDGVTWTKRHEYGATGMTIGEEAQLEADMDEKFNVEDTFVEDRYAYLWRIACMERLEVPWKVREFDFFDDEACSNSLRGAVTDILQSSESSWPAKNAFDRNEYTVWRTQCGDCLDIGASSSCACLPGEAYIGLRFLRPVRPRCLVLQQLEEGRGQCRKLSIYLSDDIQEQRSWTLRSVFENAGSNVIQSLPPRASSQSEMNQAMVSAGLGIFLWWPLMREW